MKSLLNHGLLRIVLGVGLTLSIVKWMNPVNAQNVSSGQTATGSILFCNSLALWLNQNRDQVDNYRQALLECKHTQDVYQIWSSEEMATQDQCLVDASLNNSSKASCMRNITPAHYDQINGY